MHAQQLRRPATQVSTTDSQFGTRIGFDPKARTVAESCNAATQPDQPAAHPTRPFDRPDAGEPQQPGYLSHSDAAAAPVDRFAYHTLRGSSAELAQPLLSVPDESIAVTKRGQRGDRQSFEPAFPVGPFFPQYRLGI